MTSRTKLSAFLLVALAGLGVAAFFSLNHEKGGTPSIDVGQTPTQDDSANIAKADANAKRMAGADKPKEGTASPAGGGGMASPALPSYGELKPMLPTVSPQAKSATEAALTKTHPERLSCAIAPAPFDAAKWHDTGYRKAYLETPEPGRCYQSLAPGKDVPRVALASPAYVETIQGQPVELRIKAPAGQPTTFTSFDAAHFTAGSGEGVVGSQLTTQTVVAGDDGIATAVLVAPSGVIENCRIRASSPAASGFVTFNVFVKMPALSKPVASTN